MFKKTALALTFVAAFSAVGLSYTNSAQAWRDWGRPNAVYYGAPYVAPRAAYYAPYGAYYGGPVVVGPRVIRPYRTYYAGPDVYYYGPRRGVSVSVGF